MWKKGDKAGKAAGRRHLKEALKGHNSWKPFDSGKVLRFTDQLDVSGMTAPQASHHRELRLLQRAFSIALVVHGTPGGMCAADFLTQCLLAKSLILYLKHSTITQCFGKWRVFLSDFLHCDLHSYTITSDLQHTPRLYNKRHL